MEEEKDILITENEEAIPKSDSDVVTDEPAVKPACDGMTDEPVVEPDAETTAAADGTNPETTAISDEADRKLPPEKKKGFKAWWDRHKPSKRRLIQIYALLLYNANMRGFIKGEIFTGITKSACVPGLNCYSCPGAVGACPLGALQNALAGSGARAPYFIFGILLLYGLIFARTICGWLCPMGLGQDLLYKIRTPKLKKSRVTYVLSYLKYVILAVLVIGIPLVYAIDKTAVPGFCKYICPAGTLEGAVMLLIHPSNDSMYTMLGALFSWKTAVLICVFTASIFIYRFFCRFLCPLGAIYGLFNRFALLGIKVNKSKCTNCGKCVAKCKMDIKKVGDHECINCGDCIDVCPTKAITWKGSKVFMKNVDESLVRVTPANEQPEKAAVTSAATVTRFDGPEPVSTAPVEPRGGAAASAKPKHDRSFWIKFVCIILAVLLYAGVFTYANFFAVAKEEPVTYEIAVSSADGKPGLLSFKIGDGDGAVVPSSGTGTETDPYVIGGVSGKYDVVISSAGQTVYFKYETTEPGEYKVTGSEGFNIKVNYVLAGVRYALYDSGNDGDTLKIDLKQPGGFGNTVGYVCYDFTLSGYNGKESITLSDSRGKITLVNFWGTWCGPCVTELPEFEAIMNAYSNVNVIAVHSAYVTEAVQPFIDSMGWSDWSVEFAQDTGRGMDSEIYTLFGGRNGMYPRTLILDADGVIRFVFEKSITYEMLAEAVESCGAGAA